MKLDGYAIAVLNGTEQKYYPLNSIYLPDNLPAPGPEIDQLFSLDGLTLSQSVAAECENKIRTVARNRKTS
jgi:hypothetical protein